MSMSRRTLLQSLPLAAAGNAAAGRPRLGCQTNAWPIDARKFPEFLAVLGRIKSHGYQGFETTFRNVEGQFARAGEARKEIAASGLDFLGVHIFFPKDYAPETAVAPKELLARVADGGAALGAQSLILSGRGLTSNGVVDMAALKRKASELNRIGAYCRERKMGLAYHNHDVEFSHGAKEMEGLMRMTDPDLVRLMYDAGHAFYAGADAISFFHKHLRRIDGVHLRDFRGGRQVPLGQGDFDLRALAKAIQSAGWTGWLVNEEERPNDVRPGDAVVEPARRHVREVFGL